MNDIRRDTGDVGGSPTSQIVKGLIPHPHYLIIYGLMLAALALCGSAFAVENSNLQFLSVGGFFALGLAAFLLIRSIELNSPRQKLVNLETELQVSQHQVENLNDQLKKHDKNELNLSHDGMRAQFLDALQNTREALAYNNQTFLKEIENSIGTFATVTADWAQGSLVTDAASYETILCKLYRQASRSVFATSNEHYMLAWLEKDRAEKILDAHKNAYQSSGAIVTRVFVFESVSKVESKHIEIIEHQDSLPFVKALVLIIDENHKIKVSSYLVRDFAIIDAGEPTQTIGVENSGDYSAVARWIFRRDPQIEKFAENVEFASIGLDKLKARLAAN